MQPTDDFRLAVHQRIERNVEAENVKPLACQHQILHQEALGTAHVQHTHPRLEAEMSDDITRHRQPATIVAVPSIAAFARAVEIDFTELLGYGDDRRILRLLTLLDVALCPWQGSQQ